MRWKILAIIVISLAIFVVTPNQKSKAFTNYTATWNATNIYDTYSFAMAFTGLDITASYRWTISLVDVNTGNPFFTIGSHTHIPGTTTDAFVVGPQVVQPYVGDWPFEYTGPFQVRDNFGKVIMRGFLAPDPKIYPITAGVGNGDWASSTGTNAATNKVHVGSATHLGSCRNAAYENYTGNWHWYRVPCKSGVQDNTEFALMHMYFDCNVWPLTGTIRFYTFDGTEIFSIQQSEIGAYQWNASGTPGCGTPQTFETFIVLNTSGDELPFIDNNFSGAVFGFNGGDDPHQFDFTPGVYYYQKRDAANAFVADGEAPFFVSNAVAGREWTIEIGSTEYITAANVNMTFRANTEEIWNDYRASQACQNNNSDWSDLTIYAFTTERNDSQTAPLTPLAVDFVECQVVPASINTNNMTALEAVVVYESERYATIAGNASSRDAIGILIEEWNLNNSTGLNFLFTALMATAMVGIALLKPIRKNVYAYLIAWTIIGGAWTIAGETTLLLASVFVLSTIALWILAPRYAGSSNDEI